MKREVDINVSKSPAILVIDDEQNICDFFVDLFDEYGIKIDTAQSGKSGLEMTLKNSYSLIFLDVKLGDMNGIDVLKEIKEKNSDVKVIMISAYLTESVIEQAIQLGVDGYLYKPLSLKDIISVTLRYMDINTLRGKESNWL